MESMQKQNKYSTKVQVVSQWDLLSLLQSLGCGDLEDYKQFKDSNLT